MRSKKSKKPKKSKKLSRRPKRRNHTRGRGRKAMLAFLLFSIVGVALTYIWIDQLVKQKLEPASALRVAGVYAETLRIGGNYFPSPDQLRRELQVRRYREVNDPPNRAGEFSVTGDLVKVYTNPFWDGEGSFRNSVHGRYNYKTRSVSIEEAPKVSYIFLEPEQIESLREADRKATRYHELEDIPLSLRRAVLAIEDQRFYSHWGIDPLGIARAVVANIRAGGFAQGGSTITQQLAKNLLFNSRKTLARKILELMASISLEGRLSKDQILELYLNQIYLGQEGATSIHGFGEAAHAFFGKALKDVSISESALLAGIIRAPSYYSPRRHLDRALERKQIVLEKMRELDFINENELKLARGTKEKVLKASHYERRAPHYVTSIRQHLEQIDGIATDDLSRMMIFTGIDMRYQRCGERALSSALSDLERRYPKIKRAKGQIEGGLVAIEPHSGKVKTWVGGRQYSKNQFDHVQKGSRQIGSTIKPFLYLTALDRQLNSYKVATASSILSDRPMEIDLKARGMWQPENFDKGFRGDVTLRYALEQSLNLPAVYVAQKVGIKNLVNTSKQFDLSDELPEVPALALGATETNLLRLTNGYAALANGGIFIPTRMYSSVYDSQGDLVARPAFAERTVADEGAVYVVTNILQGVVERGTAQVIRRLGFKAPIAAKTGTSNETRDAWVIGYTPDLAVGVWVGFDDNSRIGLSGSSAAGPIFTEYLKCIEPYHVAQDFVPPDDVTFVDIDSSSGALATKECPATQVAREVFVRGTEPTSLCPLHSADGQTDSSGVWPAQKKEAPRRKSRSFWDSLFGGD